jgi:electron-transferring-flavoprotein dehydrogenase
VNIFTSFSGAHIIFDQNKVVGIQTEDKGIDKNNHKTSRYQAGIALYAKQIILAEGCRGSLTEALIKHFDLRSHSDPQTYGLGIKELWEIPKHLHRQGSVTHSIGWPLDARTYGGSFSYHFGNNLLSIGFVVGLDYKNPYLNVYEEFQRFKTHPHVRPFLENGRRIEYGARTLNEGGFQSIPRLTFPGGMIIGCAAGFLDVPKIKGIHNAMKSGMLAAESIVAHFEKNKNDECILYSEKIKKSWIWKELYQSRNIRPAMGFGLWTGLFYSALETYIFRGHTPWTFHYKKEDHMQLKPANQCAKINYPKHDNKITFDVTSSLFLAHLRHDEDQPCHLKIKNIQTPIDINLNRYDFPEGRYCPASVYELIPTENNTLRLQMNYSNCIQCKACDIKDPTQNITWTPPEGGSGPGYLLM